MFNAKSFAKRTAAGIGAILAVMAATGCDDYGYSDFGGLGTDYGYDTLGGYGPIDDDVFQNSVDAFDAYIRE